MKKDYTPQKVTETGWTDWLNPSDTESHNISCCDCGLVHTFQFAVVCLTENGKELIFNDLEISGLEPNEKVAVVFRAKRNARATGQIRRRKRKNGEQLNFE